MITTSVSIHYEKIENYYETYIRKWSGVWTRLQETQNLLLDSMILGLQGRTASAVNLLRAALESIVTGVFYHYLAQKEYREKASVVNSIRISRKDDSFSDLIDEAIDSIDDEFNIPFILETVVTKISLSYKPPLKVPTFKSMLRQISEWRVVDNPVEEIMQIKEGIFDPLSSFSHSLHEGTYIKGAMFADNINILLGRDLDTEEFKIYARNFNIMCKHTLIFYLNSTEELQRTETYSEMFSIFMKQNQRVFTTMKDIVDQIQKNITKWDSMKE
jgi:hypothetical protein